MDGSHMPSTPTDRHIKYRNECMGKQKQVGMKKMG
jgi:hypothetical protein